MSREIEIKRKLKVRLQNGHVLSYNSIDDIFKNTFKCNMFNSEINIGYGNSIPELYMELNCNVNRYLSADSLLDNLNNYFTGYSIRKDKYKSIIYLEDAIIYHNFIRNYDTINKFCEQSEMKSPNAQNWFSLFIKEVEIDLYKTKALIQEHFKEEIQEIRYISIKNFKDFTFTCYNSNSIGKSYTLSYDDLSSATSAPNV